MPAQLIIRPATVDDVPVIWALIKALAEYEKLSHQVTGDLETLKQYLFGDRPMAEVIIAEWEQKTVGFALFFHNFSTFLTQPGIHLEDLFVMPEYRGLGIGKALIQQVAQVALERRYGRLEWTVLDWNQSAIAFYQHIGATILPEWRICRVVDYQRLLQQ
ncbi:GCN5-related N-acetyltransferase [Limnospira maxima CS-328]|uniref:GCN5-related N-acetyltransferase n=1 Tax=Limnospira maxima CS-328 TaxID=513049 RepID=B5W402_LIMMA|nr:GNAT family N-acetyltransferase [Limnospira maxima]EDZ93725.1 GCN5-related N-acetyltransferase [Limnospira maxima CS-328]MDC0836206.1 GNAT family N-acetyltransferase [Limnoraphis robusta]